MMTMEEILSRVNALKGAKKSVEGEYFRNEIDDETYIEFIGNIDQEIEEFMNELREELFSEWGLNTLFSFVARNTCCYMQEIKHYTKVLTIIFSFSAKSKKFLLIYLHKFFIE